MRSRDLVFSSPPAELRAAHSRPIHIAGNPLGRHAEADPPQLHRHPGLQLGAHGPVVHQRPFLPECLTRWFSECGCTPETHHRAGGWRPSGWRAPQTRPYHLHSHVPTALPVGAAHRVLHQLSTAKLFLCLHAI